MSEHLFIFGAGASVESGAPVMNNFIDVAEDLLRKGRFKESGQTIQLVFDALDELQKIHAKSNMEMNNIETLFGAVEMARIIGKLGKFDSSEVSKVRDGLVALIVKTLEEQIKYPIVGGQHIMPSPSYALFGKLIFDMNSTLDLKCALITFNYDVALDFSLYRYGIPIDYCLGDGTPQTPNIKLMKLHGSINWARCKVCQEIVPFTFSDYEKKHYLNGAYYDFKQTMIQFSGRLLNLKEFHNSCKDAEFEELPVIVPPTWNKTDYHGSLSKVWNNAAAELHDARHIYITGYSLPESDVFFRYLFALGTLGPTRVRNIWIFNPDPSVEDRFNRLLGPELRDRMHFKKMTFSESTKFIRDELKVKNRD